MHARFYNPQLGRFLGTDPVRGDARRPQSWNLLAYVANNPMNNTDPTGLLIMRTPPPVGMTVDEAGKYHATIEVTPLTSGLRWKYAPGPNTGLWGAGVLGRGLLTSIRDHYQARFEQNAAAGGILGTTGAVIDYIGLELVIPKNEFDLFLMALPVGKVLQTGGNVLKASTVKALGLSKGEAKAAIEALKRDLRLGNAFHETKILQNGDVVDAHTGQVLGNLYDYKP